MAFKLKGFEPYSKIKDNKKPDGRAGSSSFQKKDDDEVKKLEKKLGRKLTRSEIDNLYSQLNPNNPDKD
tara:strand:+ start:1045 stop:1251 length:207 start_codon:yes stop_codon:yes gene_type:complete